MQNTIQSIIIAVYAHRCNGIVKDKQNALLCTLSVLNNTNSVKWFEVFKLVERWSHNCNYDLCTWLQEVVSQQYLCYTYLTKDSGSCSMQLQ